MHELRQLHTGKLVEGSGKRGFMGNLTGPFPTADPPQLGVTSQRIQQLSG